MTDSPRARRTYEESCKELQKSGWLAAGDPPTLPMSRPNYDDEVLGVEFFRTRLADEAFENLTLPRTIFGRSEVQKVSFTYRRSSGRK